MARALLCDVDWTFSGGFPECSGNITQAAYTVPYEYTAAMVTEALFQGFSVAFPLMVIAWGGRQLLKMVK